MRRTMEMALVVGLLTGCGGGVVLSGNERLEDAGDDPSDSSSSGGNKKDGGTGATDSSVVVGMDGGGGGGKDAGKEDLDAYTPPGRDEDVPAIPPVMGGPGCGLSSAAFCEKFDAPAAKAQQGRAGELDSRFWSAGRVAPQFTTGLGVAIGIGPGTLPSCRAGLPEKVLPSNDALICDANASIADKHLIVVAAAQNYGQSSYRIRQPFDFTNRTGTIVFDAEGYVENQLIGWISLDVTEDPVNAPSFAVGGDGTNNDEGSQWPRNGFEVQFQMQCTTSSQGKGFNVRFIDVFNEFKSTLHEAESTVCVPAARGKLNHFELRVSKQKIEVYASPVSNDGKTFGTPQLLQTANVNLPFSRGYVQISTHNHASLKYSNPNTLDAWAARWNNVGFDGPVIENWREYEVPDALTPGKEAWNRSGPVLSVGYRVQDTAMGPRDTLTLKDVDLTEAVSAKLSISGYYPYWLENKRSFALKYRFNGKAWHDRPLNAGELSVITDSHTQGQIMQMIDVPLADLVQGNNTLEFVSVNVDQGYPAAVANIDLVIMTK